MTATLAQVIESLRNELQQYGEMLALLEAQREVVAQHEPASVLNSVSAVEAQSATIKAAQRTRETHQRQLAWALNSQDVTFEELLPLLPEPYRPLVTALVQEINQLLARVRHIAEQNRDQLRHSVELMERFLAVFSTRAESTAILMPPSPAPLDTLSGPMPAAVV
jgi:uncharacterized coiled-coil protein SlyX